LPRRDGRGAVDARRPRRAADRPAGPVRPGRPRGDRLPYRQRGPAGVMMKQTYARALVTGASSGFGEHFARQLSARGTALVLVARRGERLEKLAAELGTEIEILAADLTEPAGLALVEDRLRDPAKPVDLLVNNAGVGTTGAFADLPVEGETGKVALNVMALMRLCHAALPRMT